MSCIFIFGLCMGSFMNVVVWRLPRGGSIVFPSSHCPVCGYKIRWFDNIPLISYLILLRCRCRRCKVFISPRYPVVELTTALLMVTLYVCFILLHMKPGFDDLTAGKARLTFKEFQQYFPYIFSYCILTWALLSCSLTDIATFTLPIGVCWFASIVGTLAATFWPNEDLMPRISHPLAAASCAAGVGLIISVILQHMGFLIPSFIDADYRLSNTEAADGNVVAATAGCGISPRKEILREILFLTPAVTMAIAAYYLVSKTVIGDLWDGVYALDLHQAGVFMDGFSASLFGYLVGGMWIWGIRIFGTLLFNKEAMGMGDVHLLAAVGAVCGWITPSLTFFVAPVFGLIYAIMILLRKHQKELPYGPWLSLAAYTVILFQKYILAFLMLENMPLHFLATK
ncbi:MAG TPA: prepilin peptidase [Phycisphaerae bacterium]|nr:prepilin peptidase [Phycisphaerae bacterium]